MPRVERVYLPASPAVLQDLAAGRPWVPTVAFAVTDRLAAHDPEADTEELEFAAFLAAAQAALLLVAPAGPARRVVVSADVDACDLTPGPSDDPAAVVLHAAVRPGQVAALHIDDEQAEPVVRSALQQGSGQPVGDVALLWYAPSELSDVLAALAVVR